MKFFAGMLNGHLEVGAEPVELSRLAVFSPRWAIPAREGLCWVPHLTGLLLGPLDGSHAGPHGGLLSLSCEEVERIR